MGFTQEETEELRKLWNLVSECLQEVDSSTSLPNEEEYLSSDSLYLKHLFSKLLTRAVREVITRKPSDPVEYLGHWLLNYKVECFEPFDCSKILCDSQRRDLSTVKISDPRGEGEEEEGVRIGADDREGTNKTAGERSLQHDSTIFLRKVKLFIFENWRNW